MAAIEYLEAYGAQLDLVHTVGDLYEGLLNWQWAQLAAGVNGQEELNNVFFAAPNAAELRLRADNPPTTSVGGFNGIVAITANPGYDAEANALEQEFRSTPLGNRTFCDSFFDAGSELSKNIPWWASMARFAHAALDGGEPLSKDDLWTWAARYRCIGSVDLVPFHSKKDGVTPLIDKHPVRNNHRANLKRALRNASKSTFRMVLRLRPRVVFIASAAGTQIAEEVLCDMPGRESNNLPCSKTMSTWGHELSYQLRWHRVGMTHVITMPLQLFSGQLGPMRKLQSPIAHAINRLLAG